MGRKIVLTGTKITDTNAPKLSNIDPIESPGSLFLAEPMRPGKAQWASGVPTEGQVIPNLFRANLAALVGAPESGDFDGLFSTVGLTGTRGRLERTGRGGLHAIYSNTDATNIAGTTGATNPAHATLRGGSGLRNYLAANWRHQYFLSLWTNITSLSPAHAINNISILSAVNSASAANRKIGISTYDFVDSFAPGPERYDPYSVKISGKTPGLRHLNWQRTAMPVADGGLTPANGGAVLDHLFTVGNSGAVNAYLRGKESAPAAIFYRAYLEDLTVSGRTYTEVDAIDHALYEQEMLSVGGRYYADTFTDPTTIP